MKAERSLDKRVILEDVVSLKLQFDGEKEPPRFTLVSDNETGAEFIAKILELSREHRTPIELRIRYSSVDATVILSSGSALISILRMVWGVREWLKKKREGGKVQLTAQKNREWASAQAKAWAAFHAGADPDGLVEEEANSTEEGWELVLRDKTGRIFRCSLTRDCHERFKEDRDKKFSPPFPPSPILTPAITVPSETRLA